MKKPTQAVFNAPDLVAEMDDAPLYLVCALKGVCQARADRGEPDEMVAEIAAALERWHRKHPHERSCEGVADPRADDLKRGWALRSMPDYGGEDRSSRDPRPCRTRMG